MKNYKKANLFFTSIIFFMLIVGTITKLLNFSTIPSLFIGQYTMLIPVIIFIVINKQNPLEALNIRKPGLKNMLLVIPLMLAIMQVVAFIGTISNILFKNYLMEAFSEFNDLPLAMWILMLGITPAICEELVMRGIILSNYKDISIHKAALMNGLMFGILHMNLNQFFYAAILGVVMAYLVYYTKSIFTSMFLHFLINGFSATANWLVRELDLFDMEEMLANTQDMTALLPRQAALAVFGMLIVIALLKVFKNINMDKIEETEIAEEIEMTIEKTNLIDIPMIISIALFIGLIILNI